MMLYQLTSDIFFLVQNMLPEAGMENINDQLMTACTIGEFPHFIHLITLNLFIIVTGNDRTNIFRVQKTLIVTKHNTKGLTLYTSVKKK